MKTDNVVHPADALAAALDRTSGLLTALMALYDADAEGFVGGNSFIVHGVSTASELIEEAGRALAELHEKCDLSVRTGVAKAEPEVVAEPVAIAPTAPPAPVIVAKMPVPGTRPKPPPSIAAAVATLEEAGSVPERPVQSYRELLGKVTIAEVASGPPKPAEAPSSTAELLPMLKALRKDMQKFSETG